MAYNKAVPFFLSIVDPSLLAPPVNVLRLSLHPLGMAPRIANYWEWRNHLFERLRHQVGMTADPVLIALTEELAAYPAPAGAKPHHGGNDYAGVVVPLQFVTDAGILSFISTTTVFGTPIDVTLSELALETFFPADAVTADALRRIQDSSAVT
ncbi:hypothetical protein AYR66_20280 [Noviherbaspirillum denitrificans]|uniref:MmyB-like transcription regulator ligand binding domain-containing protein n=1 Tax=Noviherbaspirillum denitrificans TaxID=1968433 RepID=A0A254TFP9_9BURK|nr:hypothetical protein AYR66_20280 [Noviherbaspirillum denitrificans]